MPCLMMIDLIDRATSACYGTWYLVPATSYHTGSANNNKCVTGSTLWHSTIDQSPKVPPWVNHSLKMKNEDDMSYFERYSSSFSKGRQWGIDNVGSSCQQGKERKKSYGINPKRFHDGTRAAAITSSIHDVSGDDVINRKKKRCKSMIHTKQLLLEAKLRVDHNNVKRRFLALKDVSVCKCWPLQEPALKHLDELNQDYIKGPGRKVSSDEDLSGNKYSPLWSLEPRIFAIEKSAAGKRKYLVCHLGRFMHHYWRFCPHSSKHFYELIREGTPCRLYFGEYTTHYVP